MHSTWTEAGCVFATLSFNSVEVLDSVHKFHCFQELVRTCQSTGNIFEDTAHTLLSLVVIAAFGIFCCLLLKASFRCSPVSCTTSGVSLKQSVRHNCLQCYKLINFITVRFFWKICQFMLTFCCVKPAFLFLLQESFLPSKRSE